MLLTKKPPNKVTNTSGQQQYLDRRAEINTETLSCCRCSSCFSKKIQEGVLNTVITSDKGGGTCFCPRSFVCLSVC